MKLSKFFITVLMITGLLVYISCRKADTQSHEKVKTETIEDKFFNSHRTTDPTEKALVDFLERQNNKLHFVEKTVKQIGYPRWDKALAVKNNSANKRGRSSNQDSVNIFYIPFVRDSQNFVNASLIIKTQATDTSFTYLCDWQYQNKPHGSPAESGSAEKHALLFMVLDNRMFGYTEFNLTDTSLFPAAVPRSGGGKKLGLLNVSNSLSAKMALAYHEICVDFYICGDLTYCANGCDYLNCISGPGQAGHCYLVTSVCEGWWEDTGGGGSTGGGSTGGGEPGGGGGNTGGGGTPPDCGGLSGGRTAKAIECGPGWEPEPIDPEIYDEVETDWDEFGNFVDDPLIFEDDDMPITFDANQQDWPTISPVIPEIKFIKYKKGVNCLVLARAQLAEVGVRELGYGSAYKTYKEPNIIYKAAAKDGVDYIISKLQAGKPVMVAVDNRPGTPSTQNADGSTDHFIVVVGSGKDANGNFFRFYDSATENVYIGTSPKNKLYYNPTTGKIQGKSMANGAPPTYHDYIVTQIRKNK